jgi:hypothetical protein
VATEPPPAEILAIIAAAVEAAWPRPVIVAESRDEERPPSWRFSGRSWGTPVAASRKRPSF